MTHFIPSIRRHAAVVATASLVLLTLACARDDLSGRSEPGATASPEVSQRFIGCIGPTAGSDHFVLSVAEGRDFTTGEPAGTVVPEKSELPEDAPPPVPPVTVTSDTPGGGPTRTTEIVTYRLVGDGGKNLSELVGHTVEVTGTRSSSGELMNDLYVTSLRDVAEHCK